MSEVCGFAEGVFHDGSRTSWSGDGARPIRWSAWYPVAPGTEPTGGPTGGTPSFLQPPVARHAPLAPSPDRRPLVLLSHGTGGSAASMSWLARRLADAGSVCIGVDHHGNTAAEPYRPEGFLCWWERADDLSHLLDRLERLTPLADHVDPERIVVAGFSLGGDTALSLLGARTDLERFDLWRRSRAAPYDGPREFPDLAERVPALLDDSPVFRDSVGRHAVSRADPRIRAAAALAPAPTVRAFVPDSVAAIERAVLVAGGEADEEAPFEECAAWLKGRNAGFELRSLGTDVGHYALLCECSERGRVAEPLLCRDRDTVDRRALHDDVARTVHRFFESA